MTFTEQVEQSLINMPMWTEKTLEGKETERILKAVSKIISQKKLGFLIEIRGNTIFKYGTLTLEEVREWSMEYYSETRVKLRAK